MHFASDWALLRAAVAELPAYLLSKEMYWPVQRVARPTESALAPQLTVGNVLLSQTRLSALTLDATAQTVLAELNEQIAAVCTEWRAHWGQKAALEHTSRLNLWRQYLLELRGDRSAYVTAYRSQVRQRVMLGLLAPEILPRPSAQESAQLTQLDALLHGISEPGIFVWEEAVAPAFSPQEYWFLYITL